MINFILIGSAIFNGITVIFFCYLIIYFLDKLLLKRKDNWNLFFIAMAFIGAASAMSLLIERIGDLLRIYNGA